MSNDSERAARLRRLREDTELAKAEAELLWQKDRIRDSKHWWLPGVMMVGAVIAGMAIVAISVAIGKLIH